MIRGDKVIYVPDNTYSCYVLINKDTIRAYRQTPYNPPYNSGNISISYRDYFITSNYLYQDGYESFGYYSTLPVCQATENLTTDFYYRLDLDKILVCFIILAIFTILMPLKIFSKLFRRSL